jgi:DsbC/DsbD-like thiol-disulfide interchange protein
MITRRKAIETAMGATGAGLAALAGLPPPATAEGELAAASPWSVGLGARMRLVRGARLGDSQANGAGIEIALDPGYKTYWRMPGEAGVPPAFDWSRSRNLASVTPAWPVPRRFDEAGASVIGYAGDNVVLPLRIAASDASAPVWLEVKLTYAACNIICVPEKGEAALVLRQDAPDGLYAALIEAAAREIPRRLEAAALGLDRPQSVRLSLAPGRKGLALRPQLGDQERILDMFVEGPENWLFGAPKAVPGGAAGEVLLPLVDHPKWVDRTAEIPFTLTILTDLRAVETTVATRPAG